MFTRHATATQGSLGTLVRAWVLRDGGRSRSAMIDRTPRAASPQPPKEIHVWLMSAEPFTITAEKLACADQLMPRMRPPFPDRPTNIRQHSIMPTDPIALRTTWIGREGRGGRGKREAAEID